MTAKEGVYYAAWMAGIIIAVTGGRMLGLNHLLCLLVGLAFGLGLAFLAEKAYDKRYGGHRPSKPDGKQAEMGNPGDVACSNPRCRWVGPARENVFCPKCGDRLF